MGMHDLLVVIVSILGNGNWKPEKRPYKLWRDEHLSNQAPPGCTKCYMNNTGDSVNYV